MNCGYLSFRIPCNILFKNLLISLTNLTLTTIHHYLSKKHERVNISWVWFLYCYIVFNHKFHHTTKIVLPWLQNPSQHAAERRILLTRQTKKRGGKIHVNVFFWRVIINCNFNRLLQNRVSAFRFRIKRKQEFETLKD